MPDYPDRDELNEQYTWDLSRIYETPVDWECAAQSLENRMEELANDEDPTASPERLRGALEAMERALVTKSRLDLYAQLSRNEDTTDDERRDRHQRAQRLAADVDGAVRTLRRRIHRDAGAARDSRDDPALQGWRVYLDDLLEQAPYTRDEAVESAIASFEPVVEKQADTVVAITTRDFDPPTIEGPDGEPWEIDKGTYRQALQRPDRAFRRRAFEAFYEELGGHEHALAAATGEKVQAHAALAEVRGFDSVREMALARSSYPDTGMHVSLPEEVHDAALTQVRQHLNAYHGLLESRREWLGVDTLRPWDLNVPLVEGEAPEVTFEALREHLLSAVAPLGEDYRTRLETYLDDRRIDVYPTRRKRTDIPAFCPSSPETGAFILANFREDVRTAFYLAHELGHAMHIEELREAQPPRYVNSPRPISEVPSLVHELLLAHHLLQHGNPDLAPFVQERRASFLAGNVYGAGLSATFLHDIYQQVEEGRELSPGRLAETYADHATEFRGPMESPDPGLGWQRQAYTRDPYHNYQYVLGAIGAVSVFHRIRDGDLTSDAYRDFLRNTGKRNSLVSFEALGVDLTADGSYERLGVELDQISENRLGQ